jgi:photosystem II stability/assembly factor-like uncharacterized protein
MNQVHRTGALFLALAALSANALPLTGQERPGRGIWEPVNYTDDLELTDVFFVTPDVGWVSGAAGTILHTADGGKTWAAQLGGDPAAADPEIERLRFFDERHGWAIKDKKLLATTDGENWQEIAPLPQRMGDFAFVSPTDGFAAAGQTQYLHEPHNIFRTRDGGRTWEPGPTCEVKAVVDGLTKQVGCYLVRFHFPSRSVGYAIADATCPGSCGPPIMAKTEDGGESWRFFVGPGDVKLAALTDLFFTGEQTGFVTSSEQKLYFTADGGATWRGMVATPGEWLRFADPETGWGFAREHLAFSTNAGARWTSRPHRFPATVNGLSFPRRDRAYVVGEHGMIYRYSIVPANATAPQGTIAAPAMPAMESSLESQAAGIQTVVRELGTAVAEAAEAAEGAAATPAIASAAASASGEPGAPFIGACCGKPVNKLDLLLGEVAQALPQVVARFRNTNLLQAGIRMLTVLPSGLGDLRTAYLEFKQAPDQASAQAALARLTGAAGQLHQSVRVAFQQELPAAEAATESGAGLDAASARTTSASPADEPDPASADRASPVGSAEGGGVSNAVKQAAEKKAKSILKPKLRMP